MVDNYLQTAINLYKTGQGAALNHLGFVIGEEQQRLRRRLEQTGFWYIDIPRTSSTAIRMTLGAGFGYPHGKSNVPGRGRLHGQDSFLLPPHIPAFLVRALAGEAVWRQLAVFTVVRDPLDWAVSLWRYTKQYSRLGLPDGSFTDFLHELDARLAEDTGTRPLTPVNFCQSDYITEPGSDRIIPGTVLRFEERAAIAAYFAEALGLAMAQDEVLVRTDASGYRPEPDEERLARRVLARDFDLLSAASLAGRR